MHADAGRAKRLDERQAAGEAVALAGAQEDVAGPRRAGDPDAAVNAFDDAAAGPLDAPGNVVQQRDGFHDPLPLDSAGTV
jgi:hypothetical protein